MTEFIKEMNMNKLKKAVTLLIVSAMLLLFAVPALAEGSDPDVFSSGYCVMNLDTGEIVFQKDMNEKKFPASITKVMTALVVLENCEDLSDTLTFSETTINSMTANSSTLTPRAEIGEQMTVEDALYGMILSSANECAEALAEYTAGSVEKFADLMNAKAKELGAVNTHFVNACGLHDENHYTTPYDMALIFRAALQNEEFVKIDSTKVYTIPKTNMHEERTCGMTHQLINGTIPFEGVYAGKTGHTLEAGRTLMTACERNNLHLAVVVMGSDNDHFYTDTEILFEYAFGMLTGSYPDVVFTPADDTVVTSGDVRVREFPSVYALQVASAMAGTSMHRVGTYAGWSRVEIAGGTYYVSTNFLTNEAGETVAPPYETLTPTDAPETQEETETETQPETEAQQETTVPATTETAGSESEVTAPAQTTSAQFAAATTHTYEVNEDVLMLAILILVVLISIVSGILVAVLIVKKG